jgi:uncharacterized membrane protein
VIRSGREVSRIEGFSDAVFGFALTLLVVSLEVPDNFDGLKQILVTLRERGRVLPSWTLKHQ